MDDEDDENEDDEDDNNNDVNNENQHQKQLQIRNKVNAISESSRGRYQSDESATSSGNFIEKII